MNAFQKLAPSLLILSLAAQAEIEGEVHVRYETEVRYCPDKSLTLPIAISVADTKGNPIEGASVALMRLGAGGYTEQDVLNPANPKTNDSGIALIAYRSRFLECGPHDLEHDDLQLVGAITVVCAGYETVSIELEERYPRPLEARDLSFTPWLKVVLESSKSKNAEQGVAPQSAPLSESDFEGGAKPQLESKPRPR